MFVLYTEFRTDQQNVSQRASETANGYENIHLQFHVNIQMLKLRYYC